VRESLATMAKRDSWPTPQRHDFQKGDPNRVGRYGTKHGGRNLNDEIAKWPTPTAVTDTGGAALCKWGGSGARAKLRTMVTPQELNGALNPDWVCWLMGWPISWTSLEPLSREAFDEWERCTLAGEWFDAEPEDVPRVATGVKNRVARLKAIGNGQVSLCAALAWEILTADRAKKRQ
jgi:hypothetical protein